MVKQKNNAQFLSKGVDEVHFYTLGTRKNATATDMSC